VREAIAHAGLSFEDCRRIVERTLVSLSSSLTTEELRRLSDTLLALHVVKAQYAAREDVAARACMKAARYVAGHLGCAVTRVEELLAQLETELNSMRA
jgi:hypothetical protein